MKTWRRLGRACCLHVGGLLLLAILIQTTSSEARADNQQLLHGRVEEIFNNPNLKLPVELHAVAGKLVVPSPTPHILRAELKSFPATMRGEWKGNLSISKCMFSDYYKINQAEDMKVEQEDLAIGKSAEAEFRFYTPSAGILTMAPPVVRVAKEPTPARRQAYCYLSIADFESGKYVRSGGRESMTQSLLKNEVRMLASNVAEQDTFVQQSWRDHSSGKPKVMFTETVYRFTKSRPFELGVEMAEVDYDPTGAWCVKILLQGTLH